MAETKLSPGEKLILVMLCDLFDHLKVKSETNTKLVREVIYGGRSWALGWEMSGIFHGEEDSSEDVSQVTDILDMWDMIERAHEKLSAADKVKLATSLEHYGKNPHFRGFDGNNESAHLGIARFLVEDLGRWSRFKGRDFNSHMPTLDGARRMLAVFEPMRAGLADRTMSVEELAQVLGEQLHPSRR